MLTIFAQLNLQDPHGYFTKEMDNFTTYVSSHSKIMGNKQVLLKIFKVASSLPRK